MIRVTSFASGILIASLVAGPLMLTLIILTGLYNNLPNPIVIAPSAFGGFFAALVVAMLIGFFVALIATIIGTNIMIALGKHFEFARYRSTWLIAGALIGVIASLLIAPDEDQASITIAIIATSAICAWLCRTATLWEVLN